MSEKEKINQESKGIAPHLPAQAPPTPFTVPDGYFEQLTATLTDKAINNPPTKVFVLWSQPLKKFAAAAVLTGILLSSIFIYQQTGNPDINKNPEGWVKKEVNSISDEKLNSFVNLSTSFESVNDNSAEIALHQQEISSLTKDISDEEIQTLLIEISQPNFNEESNE